MDYVSRRPRLTGVRVEKPLYQSKVIDRWFAFLKASVQQTARRLAQTDQAFARNVIQRSEQLRQLDDQSLEVLRRRTASLLKTHRLTDESVCDSFALIREYSGRVLGMRHHHTQIRASLSLLRGEIAEMATGEGKTLAATLACSTAALMGIPVHVVTVNDYLAERDLEEMTPLYTALGLSSGAVVHGMEPPQRRAAYRCDITYCSNKELVFDYLKDRILLGGMSASNPSLQKGLYAKPELVNELLQRGLHFAIVDEADSVFVDEARTPLIISGDEKFGSMEEQLVTQAMSLAGCMEEGEHFILTESNGVQLQPKGSRFLEQESELLGGLWLSRDYREALVGQALTALYRYQLNHDYIINDENEVQIVDAYTGRVTPGRSWGQGLHQMIELKEKLELTKPRETDAEISYQNFFRKYFSLSGMTGTGVEIRKELSGVFTTRCTQIPLLKRSRRQQTSTQVLSTTIEKHNAVVDEVFRLHLQGQPILIGCATVGASEALAETIRLRGLSCRLLNARQDKEEADIVAMAGQLGAITIATGIAGRGTDIKLSDAARKVGGLHVVITELQDASRIDRQFYGRSARQGDPGSYRFILSLEDSLLVRVLQPRVRQLFVYAASVPWWRNRLGYWLLRGCQMRLEKLHYKQRMNLLDADVKRQRLLSFSGKSEYSG